MSALSALLVETLDWLAAEEGQTVTFGGVDYPDIFTETVSGALAGEQAVPRGTFGVDIASTAPRVFKFPAKYFTPFTDLAPPINGNILGWNGWNYRVTAPDVENMSTDTLFILIYALRQIGSF